MTRYLLYTETYPSLSPDSPRQTGIGRYCNDLATGLVHLGETVIVLTNDDGSGALASVDGDATVERRGRVPRRPADLLLRAALLRRRVAQLRPDYLLVGDPIAHQVVAVAGVAGRVRHCPLFYGTELHAYADRLGYRGWHPGRRVIRRVLAGYVRRSHQPICISRYTAGLLAALGLSRRPECLVYPAVSEPFLTQPVGATIIADPRARRPSGDRERPVRFITVARISERKNQLQVLETLATLRRREGLQFQYVIVGNLDSSAHTAYLDAITRFTRDNGLEDSVIVVGNATDEEKIAWIDASDVFVMLSRTVGHSVEGFGISVIEASCRGKPVVVSDQGGMPETIIEGETGFAVSLDSPDALARAFLELARRPALRDSFGANGVKFVRANFTPRRMAERLVEQLEALDGRSPAVTAPRVALQGHPKGIAK